MKQLIGIKFYFVLLGLIIAIGSNAQLVDSFTDGNFTANPVWSGDTGNWIVKTNSSSGPAGSSNNSKTVRMKALGSFAGVEYLSTPFSVWGTSQTWGFYIGRRGANYSNNNKVYIWLYADQANLENPTINGYRIRIGQTGDDQLHLEAVTNGVGITILSSGFITANHDFGIDVVVERTAAGSWTLKSSPLPASNGTGTTALDDPLTAASIVWGVTTDNTWSPSGAGYVGIVGHHTAGSSARKAIEFDQFSLTTLSSDPYVNFAAPVVSNYFETAGSAFIPLTITNPSTSTPTTADVVLISGDATRIGNYTTQTVTFPAGSSAIQYVPITITDNTLCDANAELVFQIQNVTGAGAASAGPDDIHTMNIFDNENGFVLLQEHYFEDMDISAWIQSGSSSWIASTADPLNGVYSLRHVDDNLAGTSSASVQVDNTSLANIKTTWQFNVKQRFEPTTSNNFVVYLAANEADLTSATVDGYAVGVRPTSTIDYITLWKIENGVTTTPIVTSSYDLNNVPTATGIRVIRDENGNWELFIDTNGDFDNLVSYGVGTETSFVGMDYFGVYFKYTASRAGRLSMDDITIQQEGCRTTYYSQLSGNVDGAVWDVVPVGVPQTATFNRFTNLIIQDSHAIDMNVDAGVADLIIEPNGTWNSGANTLKVYQNLYNEGTFNPGTSTVMMNGVDTQEIGGSPTTQFYDLIINNNGADILQVGDLEMIDVFTPLLGEFDTDGYEFTLLSDSLKTASIGMVNPGTDFFGQITMQRFIPADQTVDIYPGGWVRLGNSLTGGLTLNDWNDDFITTGFTGADYEYADYPFISIYSYDETNTGAGGAGWVPATDINNPLSSTNAYGVYMLQESQLVDATGDFQKGSITHNLDYTDTGDPVNDGWNLVVNRYPSEIDFEALAGYSNGITFYSVYDTETSSYLVYNAVTHMGTAPRYIPSSQAFWVQATASGQYLQYEEDIKTNMGTSYERNNNSVDQIEISVTQNQVEDHMFVGFNSDATNNFDPMFDARKTKEVPVDELALTISSLVNQEELSINVLPEMTENINVPIYLSSVEAGTVTLRIENNHGLPQSSCLILEDLITGESYAVNQGDEITFETTENYSGTRFLLHLGAPIQITKENVSCFGNNNGNITAQANGNGPFDYIWYDENQNIIHQDLGIYSASSLDNLSSGNYSVTVSADNQLCGTSTESIVIEQPQEQTFEIYTETPSCADDTPGVLKITGNGQEEFNYEVRNENDEIILSGTSTNEVIEEIPSGIYDVIVSSNCVTDHQRIDLEDEEGVSVTFDEDEITVPMTNNEAVVNFNTTITNATSYSWLIDDEEVSSDESLVYQFTSTGDYVVVVTAENENGCSAEDIQIVHVTTMIAVDEIENSSATLTQVENSIELNFNESIGNATFEILNVLGQVVESKTVEIQANMPIYQNTAKLSSGSYVVRVLANGKNIFTQKIIK